MKLLSFLVIISFLIVFGTAQPVPYYVNPVQITVQKWSVLPFNLTSNPGSATIAYQAPGAPGFGAPVNCPITAVGTLFQVACPTTTFSTAGTWNVQLNYGSTQTFSIQVVSVCSPNFSLLSPATTVAQGSTYTLNVVGPANQYAYVLVDWGDGTFTERSQVIAPQRYEHSYSIVGSVSYSVYFCTQNHPIYNFQCNFQCATWIQQAITVTNVVPYFQNIPNLPDVISVYGSLSSVVFYIKDQQPLTAASVTYTGPATVGPNACSIVNTYSNYIRQVTCPSQAFTVAGNYTVTYSVTSNSGTNTLALKLKVFDPPCSIITAHSASTVVAGQSYSVTFVESSREAKYYTLTVDFGSGPQTFTDKTLPFTVSNVYPYNNPGTNTYTVTATSCGQAGLGSACSPTTQCRFSSQTFTVTVLAAGAVFTVPPTIPTTLQVYKPLQSVSFNVLSFASSFSVTVDHSDGSAFQTCGAPVSAGANIYTVTCPAYQYTKTGHYVVRFTASNGALTSYSSSVVIFNPPCVSVAPANNTFITTYTGTQNIVNFNNPNFDSTANLLVTYNLGGVSPTLTFAISAAGSLSFSYTTAGARTAIFQLCGQQSAALCLAASCSTKFAYNYNVVQPGIIFLTRPEIPSSIPIANNVQVSSFNVRDPYAITAASVAIGEAGTSISCTVSGSGPYAVSCPAFTYTTTLTKTLVFFVKDANSGTSTISESITVTGAVPCGRLIIPTAVYTGSVPNTFTYIPDGTGTSLIATFNPGSTTSFSNVATTGISFSQTFTAGAGTNAVLTFSACSGPSTAQNCLVCSTQQVRVVTLASSGSINPAATSLAVSYTYNGGSIVFGVTGTSLAKASYPGNTQLLSCTVVSNTVTCPAPPSNPSGTYRMSFFLTGSNASLTATVSALLVYP